MYSCYILYSCLLDRYYVGHTEDIATRLLQHNNGESNYTSKAKDWELVYEETFSSRTEAHTREREIKKKKSRKYIEWLIGLKDK